VEVLVDTIRTTAVQDTAVDRRVALSGLWISTLFVFAYVDIFGFWRADVVQGALAGEVPDTGFQIDQTFLVLTTLYILVPSLMVALSLLVPTRIGRVLNITTSLLYVASILVTVIGETWVYYLLGSAVEVVLLLTVTWVAWRWRPSLP
jgi:hypothetical protein